MTTPATPDAYRLQVESQIRYFDQRKPETMLVEDTPYIRRHFGEAVDAIGLRPGERVCEWGAGLGRFSAQFLAFGCRLTSIELSPALAEGCAQVLRDQPDSELRIGDVLDVSSKLEPEFDVVAGFFMLHHLPSHDPYIAAAARLLRPGGRMIFIEPNPMNPFYPVQITLTPGMRWSAEGGIYRLWPQRLRRAAANAGLNGIQLRHYGALPRQPYNWLAPRGLERLPEYLTPRPLRPFTILTARR
ncbi:MAG: class I SAM-dependent methyltransferase [Panacagrimonas sp.]